DRIACPIGLELQEGTRVDDLLDYLMHSVRLGGIQRDDMVEGLIHRVWIARGLDIGRVLHIVGRHVGKECLYQIERFFLALHAEMRHAAYGGMYVCTSQ